MERPLHFDAPRRLSDGGAATRMSFRAANSARQRSRLARSAGIATPQPFLLQGWELFCPGASRNKDPLAMNRYDPDPPQEARIRYSFTARPARNVSVGASMAFSRSRKSR